MVVFVNFVTDGRSIAEGVGFVGENSTTAGEYVAIIARLQLTTPIASHSPL